MYINFFSHIIFFFFVCVCVCVCCVCVCVIMKDSLALLGVCEWTDVSEQGIHMYCIIHVL